MFTLVYVCNKEFMTSLPVKVHFGLKLDLPSCSYMPPPTSPVAVYTHVLLDTYREDFEGILYCCMCSSIEVHWEKTEHVFPWLVIQAVFDKSCSHVIPLTVNKDEQHDSATKVMAKHLNISLLACCSMDHKHYPFHVSWWDSHPQTKKYISKCFSKDGHDWQMVACDWFNGWLLHTIITTAQTLTPKKIRNARW